MRPERVLRSRGELRIRDRSESSAMREASRARLTRDSRLKSAPRVTSDSEWKRGH